jgi:hypothetical protein
MTSATCAGVYVGGHPARGRSASPASPAALKRLIQRRTVSGSTPCASAIAPAVAPPYACQMIRARSTARAGAVRACARRSSVVRSSFDSARTSSGRMPTSSDGPSQRRTSRAA